MKSRADALANLPCPGKVVPAILIFVIWTTGMWPSLAIKRTHRVSSPLITRGETLVTNSLTNRHDAEHTCPLGDLAEALSESWNFYRQLEKNDPNYREATGWDEPEIAACRRVLKTACSDDNVEEVCINGVCWQRSTVPMLSWTGIETPPDPHGGHRSHHHTTFEFAGHTVHVDFIQRSTSGPGSGVDDFQFFVDGEFISRGGHSFTVPACISRGEPAAMYWNEYLIICKRNIQYWGVPHASWFTLWKRQQSTELQGDTTCD